MRRFLIPFLRVSAALMLAVLALTFHSPARARVVHVPANVSWLNTGITITPGQIITISASGSASTLPSSSTSVSGPDGQGILCPDPGYPPAASYPCHLNGAPYGALIGRIGGGARFRVGAAYQVEAAAAGKLYLGVNDHLFWVTDNLGGYDVQITVVNPDAPWCASPDVATVTGCAEVSIKPAGLVGDFYAGSTLLAAAQNPGRLVLPPGANKIDIRNVKSTEQGFGSLFIYTDTSVRIAIAENQVRPAAVTARKRYIRGTLELTCDIKNHAGENVGCSISLDGTPQPASIAAGQKGSYVLDPGSHTVSATLTGDPGQTVLWAPATVTRTVSIAASPTPRTLSASFVKAGHLTATLDQPGVVGDWYLDGTQVATQTAGVERWVASGASHQIEARNLTVVATPLIHPWAESSARVTVPSGQSRSVTVKLQSILPGGVKVLSHPQCPAPPVTAADDVVLRIRWASLRRDMAEQNADHLSFRLLLDGMDVGDIRPYRRPAQGYNPASSGCGTNRFLYIVHWDVPLGKLAAGTHTLSVILFTDAEISDGESTFLPGEISTQEKVFVVGP